ncbi:MAG: zinc permease [Actinomycetota bacterium]|nr:zinc permease [Actinomycetota bacterium]
MLKALLFGLGASSGLVVGGVLGALWQPPKRLVAVALAFASGTLITALAFELFRESFKSGGLLLSAIGLLAGAAVFVAADTLLERYTSGKGASGFVILAGITLDGIPENVALGLSLLNGVGSVTLLVAIFASNLPESLGGAVGMRAKGHSRHFVALTWVATAVLLTAAVVVGNTVLSEIGEGTLSVLRAFAGGAVLASVADTLMPDAYKEGGPLVAFATAAGFLLSFALSHS